MAIHAAIELIADKPADAWVREDECGEPDLWRGVFDRSRYDLELNYRYDGWIAYYRKAIEARAASLGRAVEQLGINLMRLGQTEEPLKELQLCLRQRPARCADGEQPAAAR